MLLLPLLLLWHVVQARLRAMEGKILKGEARGGLVQVTRKKEEQLARREQELQRRWVDRGAYIHLFVTRACSCCAAGGVCQLCSNAQPPGLMGVRCKVPLDVIAWM
jgi:hypothetical protein